jgi:RNA polymerase sigma-70 factor (ECF subfamily)
MWSRFVEEKLNKDSHEKYELLNELYKQMFIVAYAKMKNKTDALDVVQESWVKILNKIDTLKDKDKLMQWAKTIVSNTAVNALKKKSSLQEVLIHEDELEYTCEIQEEVNERIMVQEIYKGIKELDPEIRKIFICKFSHGWKDQQIADELKLPLGTVKAKLHRGKERLRSILMKIHNQE